MAEKDIKLIPILKRFPPGDRWVPVDEETPVLSSLTEGIEWVFQVRPEKPTDYVLKAKEGLVYIGDILDYGDGWVDMETAEMLLAENC